MGDDKRRLAPDWLAPHLTPRDTPAQPTPEAIAAQSKASTKLIALWLLGAIAMGLGAVIAVMMLTDHPVPSEVLATFAATVGFLGGVLSA